MASTLQQLAQHPEVQKKAHDEVVSVAGKDGVITDEVMQKLSYIKAIQKETARYGYVCLCAHMREGWLLFSFAMHMYRPNYNSS